MLPGARVRVWIAGGVQRQGEAAYYDRLVTSAASAGLDAVVSLLGEREDVPTLLRLADVYCQPNLRGEPFGIAIAEAMRSGLPCVVSAAGGASELLDESCAIVTAPGDAAAVAAALEQLAGNRPLRDAMGRAAIERSSRATDPRGRLDELETVLAAAPA
jgi:rhamnosyl/mannosyltransferase